MSRIRAIITRVKIITITRARPIAPVRRRHCVLGRHTLIVPRRSGRPRHPSPSTLVHVPVYPHVFNIFSTTLRHNKSSSTTSTRSPAGNAASPLTTSAVDVDGALIESRPPRLNGPGEGVKSLEIRIRWTGRDGGEMGGGHSVDQS